MIKSIYKSIFSERQRIVLRRKVSRAAYPFYLGKTYHCNICGKSFRKMLPKGNVKRYHAKCPYCFSLERERVLDLYLDRELGVYQQKGLKILHFAPEPGLEKKLSAIEGVEYIDADINPANANHVIDITNIQYPDGYFDLIICSHVLGHVPQEAQAINEMMRALKEGGIALVMTLINQKSSETKEDPSVVTETDRLNTYGEPDLCRLHGLDMADRLKQAGFQVEVIDYRTRFSTDFQKAHSLGDGQREIIFKCAKSLV